MSPLQEGGAPPGRPQDRPAASLPSPREEQMEQENQEFLGLQRKSKLRATANGDQRCDNCHYYVGEHKKIAYCDHPEVRILVGGGWWCQWWEIHDEAGRA